MIGCGAWLARRFRAPIAHGCCTFMARSGVLACAKPPSEQDCATDQHSFCLTHYAKAYPPVRLGGLQPKAIRGAAGASLVEPAAAADDAVEVLGEIGLDDAFLRPLRILFRAVLVIVRVVKVAAPFRD